MDYYQTLGVGRNATQDEIKKAYRSAAMKHHPDRGGDQAKFKEVEEAYRTLSDDQKRAEYDNPQSQFGGFQFGGTGFEQFFGQGSPFGDIFGFQGRRPPINRDIQLQTSIPLEDAFYGKEILANVQLLSGREQTINVRVPRGIHEGTTLRLSGMGDDSIPNLARGNIMLTIHVMDHPIFKRQGDDLVVEQEITAIDAMIGSIIRVTGIDSKSLETQVPAGIQNDAILALAGHGMPNFNDPNRRGRLLIKIKIRIPNVTEEQKAQLRKLNIK
jgi:curved DNA-binding protein